MMTKNKYKMAVLVGIIFLSAAGLHHMSSLKDKEVKTNNNIYAYVFENFTDSAEIEVIQKNENGLRSTIVTDNKSLQLPNNPTYVLFHIQDEDHYIDIQVTQNKNSNQLAVEFSGLKAGNKVALSSPSYKNNTSTPVDWAGKINLTQPLSNQYCLHIITDKKQNICLTSSSQQVTS